MKFDRKMDFTNEQNKLFIVNEDGKEKELWDSRSVALDCVILAWTETSEEPYVLISERGPAAADFQGYKNIVCGYLDRNETGTMGIIREVWEEVGINLIQLDEELETINDLEQPWYVNTDPSSNRQNVSLRYGICILVNTIDELPETSTENNEKEGEVTNIEWIPFKDVDNYKWAFNHNNLIKEYLDFVLIKNDMGL